MAGLLCCWLPGHHDDHMMITAWRGAKFGKNVFFPRFDYATFAKVP